MPAVVDAYNAGMRVGGGLPPAQSLHLVERDRKLPHTPARGMVFTPAWVT